MAKRKRARKEKPLIDDFLLSIKEVPEHLVKAEKITEKLLNKKLTPRQKNSVKFKAAINNYRKAVTRKKRADTLLEKHYKILLRLVNKFSNLQTDDNDSSAENQ
jgi:hypothetical protein